MRDGFTAKIQYSASAPLLNVWIDKFIMCGFGDLSTVYPASHPMSAGLGWSPPTTLHRISSDRWWMDYVSEMWINGKHQVLVAELLISLWENRNYPVPLLSPSCCETNYWISLINFVLKLISNDVCILWLTQVTNWNLCFVGSYSKYGAKVRLDLQGSGIKSNQWWRCWTTGGGSTCSYLMWKKKFAKFILQQFMHVWRRRF